jgi:hypothetical protein
LKQNKDYKSQELAEDELNTISGGCANCDSTWKKVDFHKKMVRLNNGFAAQLTADSLTSENQDPETKGQLQSAATQHLGLASDHQQALDKALGSILTRHGF